MWKACRCRICIQNFHLFFFRNFFCYLLFCIDNLNIFNATKDFGHSPSVINTMISMCPHYQTYLPNTTSTFSWFTTAIKKRASFNKHWQYLTKWEPSNQINGPSLLCLQFVLSNRIYKWRLVYTRDSSVVVLHMMNSLSRLLFSCLPAVARWVTLKMDPLPTSCVTTILTMIYI